MEPEPTYDPKYNNPVWSIPATLKVEREDNSLSLRQHLGTFDARPRGRPKRTFDVYVAVGGYVFIIQDRKSRNSYAVDMRETMGELSLKLEELDKVPKRPNKRKEQP